MHETYLLKTLELAQIRRGFCAQNPSVGAVVVKNDQILAEGFHWAAGKAHAEVEALSKLSLEESRGATLYVSLEPCTHHGKTPPCTDLIIERGIQAVYYGFQDPNPLVNGQAQAKLAAAGIQSFYIPLPEIAQFYQSYAHWTVHKRPWVTAKLALSLDGKIAGPRGKTQQITGEIAQNFTHESRKRADAILTTAKSTLQDDPQLNVRLPGDAHSKPIYVLDRTLSLTPNLRIFKTAAHLTIFHALEATPPPSTEKIRYIAVPQEYGRLSLTAVLEQIGRDGVHDLYVEAGGECFSQLVTQKLVQRAILYVAPRWLGADAQSAFQDSMIGVFEKAKTISWQTLGNDAMCELILM